MFLDNLLVKTIGIVQVELSNGEVGFGEAYAGIYCLNYLKK